MKLTGRRKVLFAAAAVLGVFLGGALGGWNACARVRVEKPSGESSPVMPPVVSEVFRTNVVERIVTVTNRVTVSNVVVLASPVAPLSARKTAPLVVTSESVPVEKLRAELSKRGARVVSCVPSAKAVVEAPDKIRAELEESALMALRPMCADEKIASSLRGVSGETAVFIVPLSHIDLAALASAVADLGGKSVERVARSGGERLAAVLSAEGIRRMAERGDVLKIERDNR